MLNSFTISLLLNMTKLHYPLLICFVFTMPFSFRDVQLNNFLIILLVVNSILLLKNENRGRINTMVILFISVYFIHLFGMMKTDNWHQAFFDLEKKISILIFPIVLFYSPKLNLKEITSILLTFAWSC